MKIVINTRLLLKGQLEGIGWFTYETIKRIVRQHPEHEFILLFDRPYDPEFVFASNAKPVVLFPPARHPFLWLIWFEWSVRRYLNKLKPDLFVSCDGFLPLFSKTPSLSVIHDINFEHRPQDLPWLTRVYYTFFFRRFAHKATRVATVSVFSKLDIAKTYGIDVCSIDVVYNGANTMYVPLDNIEQVEARSLFADNNPYFIFIGALHPRKNVEGLLKAFDLFKEKSGCSHRLIIVGEKMFKTASLTKTFKALKYKADVHFTGRLDPGNLRKALGGAEALVFVPFFEGFGIPVLEAFYMHIPVIASNVTSVPEVAGEAAILVDPSSPNEIADAMLIMASEPDLRSDYQSRAMLRKLQFSWNLTAEKLWKSMCKCVPELEKPKR